MADQKVSNIGDFLDHTNLKAMSTEDDINKLCKEAANNNFVAVCVNGCWVKHCKDQLKESSVKVAAVIGFPLGSGATSSKVFEAKQCVDDGAEEIDMVINVGLLKSYKYDEVREDIRAVKEAIGTNCLKVILECCYLTDAEKKLACKLSVEAGADYVKTSTGFGTGGATVEDVVLMKEAVEGKAKIKAAGGIRDYETAKKFLDLGIERIGTSGGVAIHNQWKEAQT